MELTDPKVLAALIKAAGRQRQVRPSQHPLQAPLSGGPIEKRVRCRCGKCTMCIDNARWDKIFNAKFADPDYYTSRPARGGSSLDWVRPAIRTNARPAER